MIARLFIALFAAFLAVSAHAVTVTATFKIPTARENGVALPVSELATCRLYDVTGTAPVKLADMGLTGTYEYITTQTGERKFAADCVDKNGIASKLSSPATVVLESSSPPKAATFGVKLIYTQPATSGTTQ